MRIAILVYGLNRSIEITHESINKSILKPLKENDIEYDMYVHTYSMSSLYSNVRNNEKDLKIDPNTLQVLNPLHMTIEDQDEFDKTFDISDYNKHGDIWKNRNVSLKNVIRGLHSLKEAYSSMVVGIKYDGVLVIRPDTLFNNDLNIGDLKKSISNNDIYLPGFHSCGGFNDRFAFGSTNRMKSYCLRYNHLLDYASKYIVHSEGFLKHIIQNAKNTNIKFMRVRANGKIHV